jgi:hypothetical protein
MTTPLIIIISLIAAAVGVYCGCNAFLRQTSGPQDITIIRRFAFHSLIVVTCFIVSFVLTPESYHKWLVIPLMITGLILVFRFRSQRRTVHSNESFLDPRRKDGSWIKKVR